MVEGELGDVWQCSEPDGGVDCEGLRLSASMTVQDIIITLLQPHPHNPSPSSSNPFNQLTNTNHHPPTQCKTHVLTSHNRPPRPRPWTSDQAGGM